MLADFTAWFVVIGGLIALVTLLIWKRRRDDKFERAHRKLLKRFEEVTGRSPGEAMAEVIAKRYQMSNDDIEREAGYIIQAALDAPTPPTESTNEQRD